MYKEYLNLPEIEHQSISKKSRIASLYLFFFCNIPSKQMVGLINNPS